MSLRTQAKGRNCQVRLWDCKNERDTVVGCHINDKKLVGAGMGMKVPDLFIFHACKSCHDQIDGRKRSRYSPEELKIAQFEAMVRTQNILWKEEIIGELK